VSHLLREHAPMTAVAWKALDDEARERLVPALAARKLVDFAGPMGWEHAATSLGRVTRVDGDAGEGVSARQRRVLGLVELRAPFVVARDELRDLDRGAADVDLDELDTAAKRIAVAENRAVFAGLPAAGIAGIATSSAHAPIALGDGGFDRYPTHVACAVENLLSAGIEGPYGLALSPAGYRGVVESTERGGYPLLDHLRKILGGPLVWAPGLDGAVVASLRGGDFLFESGQDLAIGYEGHDAERVELFLVESFSFRVVTPEAAVTLTA
jgi:uncharacterized linocin/CFP29 family protein